MVNNSTVINKIKKQLSSKIAKYLTADNPVFQYSNANARDTRFELFREDYRSCAMFS
jgi:chromosomal replication initiation ATPase DnaA